MNLLKNFRTSNFINSPYLFIYKSQVTSTFSLLMRISGFLLFFVFMFFIIFNDNIYFIFNSYNYFFEELFAFNSFISYIFYIYILFFFIYHIIFSIRYVFNLNFFGNLEYKPLLNISEFYRSAFLNLSVVIFSLIFCIFYFY